jgi:hypothetical protein
MEDIIQKYGILFSIKILHPEFIEGTCPYLDIVPDTYTKKVFRNLRLTDKNYPGEIKIVTLVDEIKENNKTILKPAYDIDKNQHLIFLVKPADSKFFELPGIDLTGFPRQVFYFSNSSNSTKVQAEKCAATDSWINVSFTKGKVPLSVSIVTGNNKEIVHRDINKTDTGFKHDLSGCESGLYTLVTEYGKTEKTQTQIFYYNPLLRKESIVGIVNISPSVINTVNDNKNIFNIPFGSK